MTKKINSDQQKVSIIPDDFLEAADYKYRTEGVSYEYSLYEYAQKYKKIKLSKEQELSFHRLIKRVEERLLPEQRRTNAINAQMMHEIVKAIGRKKHVTDLAAGLGGIIWQLDYVNCIQDINQNFLNVAELIAYQKGNTVISVHSADSIKEALPFDGKGIFLFDPPMGQNRIKPDEWKQFNASSKAGIGRAGSGKTGDKTVFLFEILGENLKDTSSLSENLFIINFLLRAADDAYFICLVPETFLTKNENEYNNLRAYLIKNSLLAVIKPPASSGINTVVLYGQKKRKKDNQVKLITTKKYDYQEIIDYIFEDKEIKSEDIKSDVLNPTEITEPYLIKMPVIVSSKGYVYRCGFLYELNGKDETFEEQFLSDGENGFMSRYALLYLISKTTNEKFLILLDEPETHFNEHWKRYFLKLLCDVLAQKDTDVFVATHSAMLVSDVKKHELHRFELNDNEIISNDCLLNSYGANIIDIGQILFKMEGNIGERAKDEIEKLLNSNSKKDIEKIERLLSEVGPGEYRWRLRAKLQELMSQKKVTVPVCPLVRKRRKYA